MKTSRPDDVERDAFGALVLTGRSWRAHAVRDAGARLSVTAPDAGVSLVGPDGRERRWIDRVDALPPGPRALLEEELAARDFAPTLDRLHGVSSFGVPSTWRVETDRGGQARAQGRGGHPPARRRALLITSAHGVQFAWPTRRRWTGLAQAAGALSVARESPDAHPPRSSFSPGGQDSATCKAPWALETLRPCGNHRLRLRPADIAWSSICSTDLPGTSCARQFPFWSTELGDDHLVDLACWRRSARPR